jgi:hypothetical protein
MTAYSPDGSCLAVVTPQAVVIHDASTHAVVRVLLQPQDRPRRAWAAKADAAGAASCVGCGSAGGGRDFLCAVRCKVLEWQA